MDLEPPTLNGSGAATVSATPSDKPQEGCHLTTIESTKQPSGTSSTPSDQPQVSPATTAEPSQQSHSTKDDVANITSKSLEEKEGAEEKLQHSTGKKNTPGRKHNRHRHDRKPEFEDFGAKVRELWKINLAQNSMQGAAGSNFDPLEIAFLKDQAKNDPHFMAMVEHTLETFVMSITKASSSRLRTYIFEPMMGQQRKVIHLLANKMYGCETRSHGIEPDRCVNVFGRNYGRSTVTLPAVSLTKMMKRENFTFQPPPWY